MKATFIGAIMLCSLVGRAQKTGFSIYFDFNQSELTSQSVARLDSFLIAYRIDTFSWQVTLDGHCDSIGSNAYNKTLSEQRVATTLTYLLTHGIDKASLVQKTGHGKTQPLNDNKTEEERQLNRRVEIGIIKNEKLVKQQRSLKERISDSATIAGSKIVLKNINFHGGMHQLLPSSLPALTELLEVMKTYPKLKIEIQGHICCQPHSNDGMDVETRIVNLSEARARAIHDYLISNGIESTRVAYRGFGHSEPIYPYPEQSEDERIANRRVEIKVLDK